ncbi:glycosyltransferase family 2 protein [Mumia sp. Pv 4-285]|uniref:glycosyltransferase family 2 protein n=1 Tax=Mumia qirimensis TaxID=3234852 RepID=UPI00351D2E9F
MVDVGGAGWWERVRGGLPWGGPRVSVVVPVFEPGSNIVPLLASLDAQSLGRRAVELVFVDDGSRDGETLGWLRARAAERSNMVVVSIPGSGWPGRPRNVGLERARGEYVFFSDQDDELFPEALERMVAMADRNGSDVVAGKVVRVGGGTPYWGLAGGDVERADLVGDGVMQSRTVHKLFRRSFLVEHGIRFLEGRVRLEDHHFMGQVFGCSPVVSVLASSPCYRWIDRRDGTNSSAATVTQAAYWEHYGRAVDAVDRPGADPAVVTALRTVGAAQAMGRAVVANMDRIPADDAAEVFAAVSGFVRRSVPESVDAGLPVWRRAEVGALRRGDAADLFAIRRAARATVVDAELIDASWDDGLLRLVVLARLRTNDPALVRTVPGTGVDGVSEIVVPAYSEPALAVGSPDAGWAELSIRERDSGIEWPVSTVRCVVETPRSGDVLQTATVEATLDPQEGSFGQRLDAGQWTLHVRSRLIGRGAVRPVPVPPGHAVLAGRARVRSKGALRRARVRRGTRGALVVVLRDGRSGRRAEARPEPSVDVVGG